MNTFFKTILSSVGIAALGLVTMEAGWTTTRSSHQAHQALATEVGRAGITVYINHKICDENNSYGMYIPAHKAVVICQENRVRGSRDIVAWTEEDYDTLRHEVHHVVQDCMDSTYNGILSSVYKDPIGFGVSVMGKGKAVRIANLYEANGASNHIQVMEIEAFAVAAQNNPADQIQDIRRYCF